jgi:hypothetical protein
MKTEKEAMKTEKEAVESELKALKDSGVVKSLVKEECCICADGLVDTEKFVINDHILVLRCLHMYHNKCITQWIGEKRKKGTHATCPMCRALIVRF